MYLFNADGFGMNESQEQHNNSQELFNTNGFIFPNTVIQQIYPQDLTYIYQPLIKIFGEENFASIDQITPQLIQLHIYGEIFTENGFVVRSDKRKKHNIQKIKNALNKIVNIFCCTFKYNNDETIRSGFIAQQLQQVVPELVHEEIDGTLSIDSLALIPVIIESLKTLKNILNDIKAKQETTIKEAKQAVISALNIIQQENKQQFDFTFMLGPLKITLPLVIITLLSTLSTILLFPELPFIISSQLITAVLGVISISRMPQHMKRFNSTIVKNIIQSTEELPKKIKQNLSKKTIKEMKKQIGNWFKEKEFTNYQKSLYLSYFIILNINVCAIAISFIYGSCLIRFFGFYLATLLLFWGCTIKYCNDISFYHLFKILTTIFMIAVVLCFSLIKIQPSLECKLYQFNKENVINLNTTSQINFLLTTRLPWNCINPSLITDPSLPSISTSTPFNSLSLLTDLHTIKPNDKTSVYLVCSGFIKFECGTFTFI
ncbi:hypothetical protein KM1_038960 [Entamoeba histolytica HM-3:IMSS]|uniref:Peptidase S74 domain-containing protein n=4 Tax=Entamoeba histolytica TaxID=5759 RepID=C4M124_ENTH1|nr:hypothetical protein EHI_105190 [Entamoeba histolytica HM-1:IMSS]EAL48542.1 hypothetical protein EHI_105190 [Entamoeba histolytica HM-1:IMSS]EMS14789.1 hypothetical protein KM1_038960 [Entamoeba histolytica HM-3:IMSS]ENY63578.1 hypothetical protein EHI7A_009710 [Entamoeba histolytica HM-1:IMSS-A]GAT94896.1 hypothetical protein CL6EHI_105190 [Entamoeba histolytica]|eukprot:XP_653929.1 hypothetical protein EHI_105190 [Entamoeba histolytica HM-1:IMSS]